MPAPSGAKVKADGTPVERSRPTRARRSSQRKVVTGVSYAWVNCADGNVRQVMEGSELPEVAPEELKRLAALGVFDEHPRSVRQRELDELVRKGLAVHALEPQRSVEEQFANQDLSGNGEQSDGTKDSGDGSGSEGGGEPLTPPILP